MRRASFLFSLAAALLAPACPAFDPDGLYACSSDEDCRAGQGERCFDGICALDGEHCGDGSCSPWECGSCAQDCAAVECDSFGCNGDGSCGADESCFSCPDDCGAEDCTDADCVVACGGAGEDCATRGDEEGDGLEDCQDGECAGLCDGAEHCDNGQDDDGDGLVDCEDPRCFVGCEGTCVTDCGGVPEDCWNAGDEDSDGLFDCLDPDCDPICGPEADCAGGTDSDGDGWEGCQDLDCAEAGACSDATFTEDCGNGRDDDADEAIDCADSDCAPLPECGAGCFGLQPDGALPGLAGGGLLVRLRSALAWRDLPLDCRGMHGERFYLLGFIAPVTGRYRFHTTGSSDDNVLFITETTNCPDVSDCGGSAPGERFAEAEIFLDVGKIAILALGTMTPDATGQLWLSVEVAQ